MEAAFEKSLFLTKNAQSFLLKSSISRGTSYYRGTKMRYAAFFMLGGHDVRRPSHCTLPLAFVPGTDLLVSGK